MQRAQCGMSSTQLGVDGNNLVDLGCGKEPDTRERSAKNLVEV